MTFSGLATHLNGEHIGSDVEFSALSTDTRSIQAGDVYLALTGERFDGNDFVEQAQQHGAAGAIVSRKSGIELPILKVADTLVALADIAALNRQRSKAVVIGLTGSQGKTTVKEMAGAILQQSAATLVTYANLNNTIGVPLTLLRLTDEHKYAVIEMGANQLGEIAFSAQACAPDVALITNASDAHIEGFGSLEGIVRAKGEILDSISEGGVAVLNADDENVEQWIARAQQARVVQFAYSSDKQAASYFASSVDIGSRGQVSFELHSPAGTTSVTLKLLGRHNVINAIAAAAISIEAGASLSDVAAGLSLLEPVKGRLYPLTGSNNSSLIDDTYNASPSSFFAAIDVLMSFKEKKVLVAGDMKELGSDSEESHRRVGEYARQSGVDVLLGVGEQSKQTVAAFGDDAIHFATKEELVMACKEMASGNTAFLVKGSRGAGMDSIVNNLSANGDV